jgi:hypothetical protein
VRWSDDFYGLAAENVATGFAHGVATYRPENRETGEPVPDHVEGWASGNSGPGWPRSHR